jgi:large subunit ribosomal protein L10e
MGDRQGDYPYIVKLTVNDALQIRHDAIEAARNTCNRLMEDNVPEQYCFTIRVYPHHVLRNNPTASGAGADRMSTGMKHSFGEPVGIAAQLDEDQTIFQIEARKDDVDLAKQALHRARKKLPCGCRVLVSENN